MGARGAVDTVRTAARGAALDGLLSLRAHESLV